MEEIKTIISILAIGIAVASLYFARRSWMQSNRPIVMAVIAPLASGNVSAVFNLIVSNTGNRPATNIRLHAKPDEIDKLISPSANGDRRQEIHYCFAPESKISILKNGEELSTAFGHVTHHNATDQCLKYGAEITVEITYDDLEGRNYKSIVPLKVYARGGFGGCSWE